MPAYTKKALLVAASFCFVLSAGAAVVGAAYELWFLGVSFLFALFAIIFGTLGLLVSHGQTQATDHYSDGGNPHDLLSNAHDGQAGAREFL